MNKQLETIISTANTLAENLESHKSIKEDSIEGSKDGISLLALKNHAMMSYLHNLSMVIASQVARSTQDVENIRSKAVSGTVTQRVALEKGIKGLESKMSYQIEKVLRAHFKATQETQHKEETKANDAEGDSDSDEDMLNYRPNPNALRSDRDTNKNDKEDLDKTAAKYQAPKIAAVTPYAKDHDGKESRQRRNATMEEYLKHSSTAPIAEPSIGSTIMDHGRGGERTDRDRQKQEEITRFEEENYTRINTVSKKQEKRAARQRQRDAYGKNFFGEDWGFSNNNNSNLESATKRKSKPTSVWERTKKKQKRG